MAILPSLHKKGSSRVGDHLVNPCKRSVGTPPKARTKPHPSPPPGANRGAVPSLAQQIIRRMSRGGESKLDWGGKVSFGAKN